MSRLENTSKNMAYSMVNRLVAAMTSTVSRIVFTRIMGETFLGINSLFTEVLSVLALTELGMETAITFYLYKPLAEKDTEKLKSIMRFYKRAYQVIALIIAGIGLSLIPFLPHIMKGTEGISHIVLIYLVFLFNTFFSYFFSYKVTFMVADQKQYWYTNILTVFDTILAGVQCILILTTKNYYIYLVGNIFINIAKYLFISYWANKKYPYLKEEAEPLGKEEVRLIFRKIKGMLFFKFSDTCIMQTDSIITSSFINVQMVGKISNYNMFTKVISGVIGSVITSAVASMGNVLVTEDERNRLRIFKTYDFLGGWICGWCSLCLLFLMTPAVELFFGVQFVLPGYIVFMICLNFYLQTSRSPLGYVKIAAGLYEKDRWIPVISAILNIIISVVGAQKWGMIGIYIGTLVSNLALQISFPIFVYQPLFAVSAWNYYKEMIRNFLQLVCSAAAVYGLITILPLESLWAIIIYRVLICTTVPNIIICIINYRKPEFRECLCLAKKIVGNRQS